MKDVGNKVLLVACYLLCESASSCLLLVAALILSLSGTALLMA